MEGCDLALAPPQSAQPDSVALNLQVTEALGRRHARPHPWHLGDGPGSELSLGSSPGPTLAPPSPPQGKKTCQLAGKRGIKSPC